MATPGEMCDEKRNHQDLKNTDIPQMLPAGIIEGPGRLMERRRREGRQ